MTIPPSLHKWLAFGRGVGVEVSGPTGAESLHVTAVRVFPGRVRVVGELDIPEAGHHGAGTWGMEYAAFLREHGMSHVPATVLLPRRDVIVRPILLPGVSNQDLAAAIEFQLEGLHPYSEADAVASWARLPGTSSILVAITRRSLMERFVTLFSEAGVKVSSFSCSAAAIYSARRLFGAPSPEKTSVLACEETAGGVEVYGESAARPVFSAAFDAPVERAAALAAAEMRLESAAAQPLAELVHSAPALSVAAALSSACPHLALSLNLFPEEHRERSSRVVWIASGVSATAVVVLAAVLGAYPGYEDRQYLKALSAEIARVEPLANRSATLDRQIDSARRRIALLDEVHGRSKADMDALAELTRILPPPTWVNSLELNRSQVSIAGETAQTAPLLQLIDGSPLFDGSEFAQPPMRAGAGEAFRIRAKRVAGGAQ